MRRTFVGIVGIVLLAAACSPGPTAVTSTPSPGVTTTGVDVVYGPTPVIVDYSPTVSDVGGLLYLLSHPDVEVLAVSLPATGEAGCELGAEVTLGILAMLGQSHIPVACSDEIPDGAHTWPEEFQPRHTGLLFGLPDPESEVDPRRASDLIAEVAAASPTQVVVWAVGPLTNVARALTDHPDVVDDVGRIVIMGGAVDVDGSPMIAPAEWNFYIDAAAAATVFGSEVPITLVPLDATDQVPVPGWYQSALAEAKQSEQIVYLANVIRTFPNATSGFYYFWDELAAAVVTGSVPFDKMTANLSVVVGGPENGWSARDSDGEPILVATGVDPNAFYNEFLTRLSGEPVTIGSGATTEEESYLVAVANSMQPMVDALEVLWADPAFGPDAPFDSEGLAIAFEGVLDGLQESYDVVSVLAAPASLVDEHDGFLSAVAEILDVRSDVIDAIRSAGSVEDVDAAMAQLPDFDSACLPLHNAAQLLGVDAIFPCG